MEITKMKNTHNCEVCGARLTLANNLATCDAICSRAKAGGRTRGQEIALEVGEIVMRPWSYAKAHNPFAYRPGNNYNAPDAI